MHFKTSCIKTHTEATKEATHYVFALNHPVYAYPDISLRMHTKCIYIYIYIYIYMCVCVCVWCVCVCVCIAYL